MKYVLLIALSTLSLAAYAAPAPAPTPVPTPPDRHDGGGGDGGDHKDRNDDREVFYSCDLYSPVVKGGYCEVYGSVCVEDHNHGGDVTATGGRGCGSNHNHRHGVDIAGRHGVGGGDITVYCDDGYYTRQDADAFSLNDGDFDRELIIQGNGDFRHPGPIASEWLVITDFDRFGRSNRHDRDDEDFDDTFPARYSRAGDPKWGADLSFYGNCNVFTDGRKHQHHHRGGHGEI